MNIALKKLLIFGILGEVIILIVSYVLHPELADTFRYAARYSGRLSALVFLFAFYNFSKKPNNLKGNIPTRNFIKLFAFLHIIHWCFLALSVYLNAINLEVIKVIGGAIAYVLIALSPFKLHLIKLNYQLTYFYYVSLVMILTYVARIKGDFPGAEPFWLHYVMFSFLITSCIYFGISIRKSIKYSSK